MAGIGDLVYGLSYGVRAFAARMLIKSVAMPYFSQWLASNWAAPTFRQIVGEGVRTNAAVFACSTALTNGFCEPPLTLYEESPGGDAILVQDGRNAYVEQLQNLLRHPNDEMGQVELMAYLCSSLAIGGETFLLKDRTNGSQYTNTLTCYTPAHMQAISLDNYHVDHYELHTQSGQPVKYAPEQIIHIIWYRDPLAPYKGVSPIMAAARDVDTDNQAARYTWALLKNDCIPRVVMSMPPGISLNETQWNRQKKQWEQNHGGENAGGIQLLEGGAKIEVLSLKLDQLAMDAMRRIPEARICAALRVPPIIAGLTVGLEHATYANFEASALAFTERTLAPMWALVSAEFSRSLLPEFFGDDNRYILQYDLSKVMALEPRRKAREETAIKGYEKGIMTRDEARGRLGLQPIGGLLGGEFAKPNKPEQPTEPGKTIIIAPAQARIPGGLKLLPSGYGGISDDDVEAALGRWADLMPGFEELPNAAVVDE